MHIQITVFAVSFTVHLTSNHPVCLGVYQHAATVVVVIVPLDASRQCGQLAIR